MDPVLTWISPGGLPEAVAWQAADGVGIGVRTALVVEWCQEASAQSAAEAAAVAPLLRPLRTFKQTYPEQTAALRRDPHLPGAAMEAFPAPEAVWQGLHAAIPVLREQHRLFGELAVVSAACQCNHCLLHEHHDAGSTVGAASGLLVSWAPANARGGPVVSAIVAPGSHPHAWVGRLTAGFANFLDPKAAVAFARLADAAFSTPVSWVRGDTVAPAQVLARVAARDIQQVSL